ncbi:hypothetical protein CEXT_27011 [Caerostris extrusa]|uniref:Uncharacterized protein n=1 Tax=Caerostris extrusa TaxID=172846 RepID=A0AAV4XEZ1_CAEEX|nr:hypothetical protein CEXT_27011 [Caerostris extrusa]
MVAFWEMKEIKVLRLLNVAFVSFPVRDLELILRIQYPGLNGVQLRWNCFLGWNPRGPLDATSRDVAWKGGCEVEMSRNGLSSPERMQAARLLRRHRANPHLLGRAQMVKLKALKEEWAGLIYYPSRNYTQQWQADILESWRSSRRNLQRRRMVGGGYGAENHETAFPLLRGCRHKIASSTQGTPASLGLR